MNDNITFGVGGTPLCMLRSDTGDGGWSLHTPEQIADADASGDVPEVLISGPAQWDNEAGDWNRPNVEDLAQAVKVRGKKALAEMAKEAKRLGLD